MMQGSNGITLGINVNGKPHDLPVTSEQLHFKSNWDSPGLEAAAETVMKAPDTQMACFLPFYPFRASQEPPVGFPPLPEAHGVKEELSVEQWLLLSLRYPCPVPDVMLSQHWAGWQSLPHSVLTFQSRYVDALVLRKQKSFCFLRAYCT